MIDFRTYKMNNDSDVLVVELSGRLNTDTCSYFFTCVEDELGRGHTKMIIDCHDLQYISSMGLGMLLRAHGRMKKQGGNVKLARIGGRVAEVIRMVGFDKVLQVYPRVRDAYESFQSETAD